MSENNRKTLFLFPGQGSQYPGIGSDFLGSFPIARETYESASDVLGYNMIELSSVNAGDKIHFTRHTQPALLTHSVASMRVFQQQCNSSVAPAFACGHSLGEYSALVAAEALGFETAVKLVSRRGELMGELGEGEMLAVPLNVVQLSPWVYKNHCSIAACNLPEQTVAGGRAEDLDCLIKDLEDHFPGKAGIRLKTEGAFHTYYMVNAARAFREVLDAAQISVPNCPVASNFTGEFHDDSDNSIQANLFYQLFHPVMWHKNLMTIADQGIDTVIEFGGGLGAGNDPAGKRPNLAGTILRAYRRVSPRPAYMSVINMKTLDATLEAISSM